MTRPKLDSSSKHSVKVVITVGIILVAGLCCLVWEICSGCCCCLRCCISCSSLIPHYQHIDSKLRDGQYAAQQENGRSVDRAELPGYAGCQPSHVARGCGKVDMVNENDWKWWGQVGGRNDRAMNRVLGKDSGSTRQNSRSSLLDEKDPSIKLGTEERI